MLQTLSELFRNVLGLGESMLKDQKAPDVDQCVKSCIFPRDKGNRNLKALVWDNHYDHSDSAKVLLSSMPAFKYSTTRGIRERSLTSSKATRRPLSKWTCIPQISYSSVSILRPKFIYYSMQSNTLTANGSCMSKTLPSHTRTLLDR